MDNDFEEFPFDYPPILGAKMVTMSREKKTGKKRYYLTIELEYGPGSSSSFPIDISEEAWHHCVRYFELLEIKPKGWETSLTQYTHYYFHAKTYSHGSKT